MENDMKSSQRLCDRIRKLRKQHGEFQKDLAYALNKSESAVRMWELGRSEPDVETIKLIAKRYSVSVSYLVGDDDEEPYAYFLSPEEKILIAAYRDRPEMQVAVNTLLGVDEIIEETPQRLILMSRGSPISAMRSCTKGLSMLPSQKPHCFDCI